MELFLILLILAAGYIVFNGTRREVRRLKSKIKKIFRDLSKEEKVYVSPHKKTVPIKGHYRRKKKNSKKN